MINLPYKTIPITEFELKELSSWDYNHNSEFEQTFKKQFKEEFRVVEFKMPQDAEVLSCRYFQLNSENLYEFFSEFTKHDKHKWTIKFVCQSKDWATVKDFKFDYFYITNELVSIRNQMKDLENEFNKKVSELNKNIVEVNGTILSNEP